MPRRKDAQSHETYRGWLQESVTKLAMMDGCLPSMTAILKDIAPRMNPPLTSGWLNVFLSKEIKEDGLTISERLEKFSNQCGIYGAVVVKGVVVTEYVDEIIDIHAPRSDIENHDLPETNSDTSDLLEQDMASKDAGENTAPERELLQLESLSNNELVALIGKATSVLSTRLESSES